MVGKLVFLLGWPMFRGYVSFRECNQLILDVFTRTWRATWWSFMSTSTADELQKGWSRNGGTSTQILYVCSHIQSPKNAKKNILKHYQ